VGALLALLFIKPFLTPQRLQYMLGFVGGIMTSVCVIELWPEAKKCHSDRQQYQGIAVGAVCMAWTLYVGV
jgi:zinc transporter, ZIP family